MVGSQTVIFSTELGLFVLSFIFFPFCILTSFPLALLRGTEKCNGPEVNTSLSSLKLICRALFRLCQELYKLHEKVS